MRANAVRPWSETDETASFAAIAGCGSVFEDSGWRGRRSSGGGGWGSKGGAMGKFTVVGCFLRENVV